MATKQAILKVIAEGNGEPVSRAVISEKLNEPTSNFQTQLDRMANKQNLVKDVGDHKYVLTESGTEENNTLDDGEIQSLSDETVGATEFQQFLRLGSQTGIEPKLLRQTANHIWNGGDYGDLNWVAEALAQMGIRRDLATRLFHSWRSYLKKPLPLDLPEYVSRIPGASGDGEKERGDGKTGKRDYILGADNTPVNVGEGNGDMDYKDAMDLSKIRAARTGRAEGNGGSTSGVDELAKAFELFEKLSQGKAAGKSYLMKPGEDGNYAIEEVDPSRPMVISSAGVNKQEGYYIDPEGNMKPIVPGQPVVIIKEVKPAGGGTAPAGQPNRIDRQTGAMEPVDPTKPIIITVQGPSQNHGTPIQIKDKDGNPLVLDLGDYLRLDDHQEKQRRDEESHKVKMGIAKGFQDLLVKATKALQNMAENDEE